MEISREVNTYTPVSVTLVCAETSIGDPWWQKSIPPSRFNKMLEGCKLFGLKKNCEDCQRQIKVWKFCHKRWLLEHQQLWLDMFMNKFFSELTAGNKYMEIILDPAEIWTQDLTLWLLVRYLPLNNLDPWQSGERHCLKAPAKFQLILILSELDWNPSSNNQSW